MGVLGNLGAPRKPPLRASMRRATFGAAKSICSRVSAPQPAIVLDVHEERVHHRSGCVVLKTFMRHHMAPVAGSISDREQYRLIFRLGFLERRCAPYPPMHGILGVLQKIRARGLAKFVS